MMWKGDDNMGKIGIVVGTVLLVIMSSLVIQGTASANSIAPTNKLTDIPHVPIRINNNTNFTETATRERWPGTGSAGDPIKIEGLDINGTGYGYGIYIGNTTLHFDIENCTVHNASGDSSASVYFNNEGIILYNVTNGSVKNNQIMGNNGGIYIEGEIDQDAKLTIEGNLIENNNDVGIYIEDACNNTIDENIIDNPGSTGIYTIGTHQNKIINNTIRNSSTGIDFLTGGDDIITGNEIYFSRDTGINIEGDSISVINNTVVGNGQGENGIYEYNGNYNYIANNKVSSIGGSGIYINGGYKNVITNNTATNNTEGIVLGSWSQFSNITYNNVSGNQQVGISIDGGTTGKAQYNLIKGNIIMNNPWRGIYFYRHGEYNTITENTIWNNSYGIYVIDSGNNTFTYNSIKNNTNYGIYIYSGTQNLIYNNTFSGNNGATDTYSQLHVQAYDDGTNNWWNISGNPHGYGNYWADWQSPDTDNNGIVDNPYNITGSDGAKDYYPLTNTPSVPEFTNASIVIALLVLISAVLIRRKL